MKILWVKAGGLVPPDLGGRIRSYQILRQLAAKHEVTLFTFYAAQSPDPHPELKTEFHEVLYWPLAIPSDRSFRELFRFALQVSRSWPYSVSKYCRQEVIAALQKHLSERRYDLIVCDFVFAAGAIPWKIACPKVLFTHNVEALIWQRHAQVSRNPLWKLVAWGEYQKMLRFERFCLERSQHVLAVSEADRAFFTRFVDLAKITVVPTGVDTEYFSARKVTEHRDSLVFTGAMDWMPNEDGILYFVRSILPLIRKEIPGVTLTIAGRNPSGKLRAAVAADNKIEVTGKVEDIRPYVHKSSVYVVPLRIGSGTRLKIFEAMAMGKAIVSSTLGAEGLPVSHGRELLIADSPQEFAGAVVCLLRDRQQRARLGSAARQLVEERHSWRMVAAEVDGVLQRIVDQQLAVYAGSHG
jgi:sugar transferase (PEP-CTERM/EpsH1 system associated)